jgi:transposase-like protein
LVAVEKRGKASGRLRIVVIPDFKATTLSGFIQQHIAVGSTLYTDALKSFTGLDKAGYRHIARVQPKTTELRKGAKSVVPLADRAIGNLQQWLIGTYHGVSRAQLQVYLDEFVFRHNRRNQPNGRFSDLTRSWNSTKVLGLPPHSRCSGFGQSFRSWINTTYWGLLKQSYKH